MHFKNLYVDGCSYVYGQGLERQYSLSRLLNANADRSEPGKSNISILEDLYNNIHCFDFFIVGFTYSNRYSFYWNDKREHIFTGYKQRYLGDYFGAESDAKDLVTLQKLFYKFSNLDILDLRSDIYVEAAINKLENNNKKYFVFTWEPRKVTKAHYINVCEFSKDLQLADGHLNEKGMIALANRILTQINNNGQK